MAQSYIISQIILTIQKEISMARTKQTARFCAQRIVRKTNAIGSRPRRRNPAGRSRSRSRSVSSSSSSADVTHQQFSIKFDNQPQCQKKAVKGSVFECKTCKAYLNSQSELQKIELQPSKDVRSSRSKRVLTDETKQELKSKGSSLWVCEFCDTKNEVPIDIQVPKEENPCYYLGSQKKDNNKSEEKGNKMIIYCIDVSGSMDTRFKNKSRIEAVREAIRDEIKRMKFQGEKIKVAVVNFGSVVTVKAKGQDIVIPNHLYHSFEGLTAHAKGIKTDFALPVQTHHKLFEEIVSQMTTYGSTALGPALVTSIELASRVRGSKIVLCTDGEANVGLLGPDFYTKAAEYAKTKGVVTSILSIKGDRCNLKELGKLTLSTGGSILKIDPDLLGSEFNKISKEKIFGTESHLRIVVNHFFEIQHNDENQISKDKTVLTQNFGNFSADTELTFNFRVLSNQEAAAKGVSMEIIKRKRLPMQIQLTYTNPDGQQYLQIVNDHRELTLDRGELLGSTNFALFSASTLQKVSRLIKDQNFAQAQAEIRRFRSLVDEVFSKKETKADLDKFGGRINQVERVLRSKKNKKEGKTFRKRAVETKKKKKKKISKKGNRSRSRSESESDYEGGSVLESDSEEQILFKELRARSCSPQR